MTVAFMWRGMPSHWDTRSSGDAVFQIKARHLARLQDRYTKSVIDEYMADVAVPSLYYGILVHLHTRHELDLLKLLRDHSITVVVRWLHQSTLQGPQGQLALALASAACQGAAATTACDIHHTGTDIHHTGTLWPDCRSQEFCITA